MTLTIDVRWDGEASVWYGVSRDETGLATESPTLDGLRQRIISVLPDLMEHAEIDVEMIVHDLTGH